MNGQMNDWTPTVGTKYRLSDRVAANIDAAIETVVGTNDLFLWEATSAISPFLQQTPGGVSLGGNMHTWLVLSYPSPILGEGHVISATVCDLPAFATDPQKAVEVVRQLVGNIRNAVADKLKSNTNGHP